MKMLMSTIGSRGDVQPLLALAVEALALGHSPSLCAPPNFREWVESHGIPFHPIGPDVKQLAKQNPSSRPPRPSAERRYQLAEYTVREQFRVLTEAACGCDLLIGGGALQIALRSIAEAQGIPYVYVAYCPGTLPSPEHPPARMDVHYPDWLPAFANRLLWERDGQSFNDLFRRTLNEERRRLGLPLVEHVQRFVFSEQPWLAADPLLGPSPQAPGMEVTQAGAWFLHDDTPLPAELEDFLNAGEPPVYLGFGSMRAEDDTGAKLVDAVRRLGKRSIILQGWANLGPANGGDDCLAIGDVNHTALLPRVAAIVHHGGAGTTHAAARAGRPQVVIPHHYDQFYWASRVRKLGIGVADIPRQRLTAETLASSLQRCLRSETVERAETVASAMVEDGARRAMELLTCSKVEA